MRTATLLILLALTTLAMSGCNTFGGAPWHTVGQREHAALRPGVELIDYTRGRGQEREKIVRVREAPDDEIEVEELEELISFCRPLDTPEVAAAYLQLVREFSLEDASASGHVVHYDESLTGSGASGFYSLSDAEAWDVDTVPLSRPFAGGIEITQVVLLPPVEHPILSHSSPWRLVEIVEVVYPDGTISVESQRILTNGDAARRYQTY